MDSLNQTKVNEIPSDRRTSVSLRSSRDHVLLQYLLPLLHSVTLCMCYPIINGLGYSAFPWINTRLLTVCIEFCHFIGIMSLITWQSRACGVLHGSMALEERGTAVARFCCASLWDAVTSVGTGYTLPGVMVSWIGSLPLWLSDHCR